MDYGILLYMSESDGKNKIVDSSKKACSYGFARESRLAKSGANLYIVLLCVCLVSSSSFFISFNPWPFVQSFFEMHAAPTATRS